MEIAGMVAALLVGVSLGLLGGGGSILMVPLLVYFFGVKAELATVDSLFIVGVTAIAAGAGYIVERAIDVKKALWFAVPSVVGVYVTRRVLVPLVPDQIGRLGPLLVTKDLIILALFAGLTVVASISMIRGRGASSEVPIALKPQNLAWKGLGVGLLTGSVGAGGGFLIVPALVFFANLPMRRAVATSLMIIAMNSLVGFGADLQGGRAIQWNLLLPLTAIAITGTVFGLWLSGRIAAARLRMVFGYFVLLTGSLILVDQIRQFASG